ncbi:hypothetical protein AWW66_22415 [Micromonospora rosaria]|uniref:Uncharacterized protein n=1 Tax=Micromonospora rosaria TaxID=47874 RepID=A0A136PMX8_9ACTN|nr:hypothetical protein [Micromonospora rosaria]KXK59781.1 hypothetical protein AWW66_22415 [Micromonospora rosaria]
MRIDDRVEHLVREALHWVVKRDAESLDAALAAFVDEKTRRESLELLVAVAGFVLIDLHQGRPNHAQVQVVAEKVAHMEAWANITSDEVAVFMNAILAGRSLAEDLRTEDVVVLAFVVAGSLLSSRELPEGQWWFDYLDQVEAAIEAAG